MTTLSKGAPIYCEPGSLHNSGSERLSNLPTVTQLNDRFRTDTPDCQVRALNLHTTLSSGLTLLSCCPTLVKLTACLPASQEDW